MTASKRKAADSTGVNTTAQLPCGGREGGRKEERKEGSKGHDRNGTANEEQVGKEIGGQR